MRINPKLYITIICLLLLISTQQAITEDTTQNKYLPNQLTKHETFTVGKVAEFEKTTVQVINPLINKQLKFEIQVNGKAGISPVAVDFKINENINIKIENEDYLPVEYDYVLKGVDSGNTITVYCYPKLTVIKGDVLNPDGSTPENIEVQLSSDLPNNYYPAYHKLRNYVDAEGKYFLLLPESIIKDKINLRFSTFNKNYEAELSLMKSQSIKSQTLEIPAYEVEIAMPEEALNVIPTNDILKTLKFKDNGKLSFEQAYKIDKVATLLDYGLLINTYISSYKLAEDDKTRDFVKSRLLPIFLDSIRHAELMEQDTEGLTLAKQALEIFVQNNQLNHFVEIFEYNNIPAEIKSALNDAFIAFKNKDYQKSYYLLKNLSQEKRLTEKLRAKAIKAFNESQNELIRVHLKKATDYYTEKNYLKSLWETDKASEYSMDLPFLKELAERNINMLETMNDNSEMAYPIRNNWYKNSGDVKFNKKIDFNKPETEKWFLVNIENYAQIKIELPLRNINGVHYLFRIYTVNEESLSPGFELFSFDSNNIKLPESTNNNRPKLGGGGGPGGDSKVENKDTEKLTYGSDYHKVSFDEFIFANGKYFVSIEADQVEGFEFKDASCGLVLDINQLKDSEDIAIKNIKPGTDRESASNLTQGFYTPIQIKSKETHWYKINLNGDMHLELNLAGASDFSNLTIDVYNDKEAIAPEQYDKSNGYYLYKLTKQTYFVEVVNKGAQTFDFSMLLKIVDSTLYSESDIGSSFEKAIPLNPGANYTGKTNRSHSMHYKFKVTRGNRININVNFTNRDTNEYEMRIYSEDENKQRILITSIMELNTRLYYRGYLDEGNYYAVVKSSSLREQSFQIRMNGGASIISLGREFQEPIQIKIDDTAKEFEVQNQSPMWLQFDVEHFGELSITCKNITKNITESNRKNLSLMLVGQYEVDQIDIITFETSNEQHITKLVGIGKYHLKVENYTGSNVKYQIDLNLKSAEDNLSFEKALEIPTEAIRGMISVKNTENKFFKLNIPQKGTLQLYSTFKFNKGDVNLKLYDLNKNLLKETTTKANDELLIFETESGEYYLEIENVTKGLINNINLEITFEEEGKNGITSANFWDVAIPEDNSQQGVFDNEFSFVKSFWGLFKLDRKRRIRLTIDTESESSEYAIKIYHGNEIVESTKSIKGNCFIDSQFESGIYFISISSESDSEISLKVEILNDSSSASIQGEFDNVTKDTATLITKTNLFPIEYQGEQALWYKVVANTNTDNLSVSLYSKEEKYEFTLSLYQSNSDEPLVVEYSNKFPVTISQKLQLGRTYFIKLEPVEPVQSSYLVLNFLVGPSKFRTNNMSYPYPLQSGKLENHKLNGNDSGFYVLSFAGRTKYKIVCKFDNTRADLDLELQKINGEIISDSEGLSNTEIIDGEIEAGIYRLIVKFNKQYWNDMPYSIQADYELLGDLLTPTNIKNDTVAAWKNSSRDNAIRIEQDKTVEGTASEIPAWYIFNISEHANVTVEMVFENDKSNLDLFLVNSQGTEIAASKSTESPEILQHLCTSGTYYLRVSSFNDQKVNNFKLTLKLEDVGGGHSRDSAVVTKLKKIDENDKRKFEANIECTMKQNFPMFFVVVFEKPAWIEVEGSISGGNGNGMMSLIRQNIEVGKEDETDYLAQLYLRDPNIDRWGSDDETNSINLGVPAGTYYIQFSGNFVKGTAKVSGTYIDGFGEKKNAPTINSGVFKGLKLQTEKEYWFKVKSNKTFKIVSSVFSETDIANVELSLQSDKIVIGEPFSTTKSACVFSEVAAGEYYIMVKNTSDKDFEVDFQVLVLDDKEQAGKAVLLKANSKASGTFERNSNDRKYFMFVLTEESKVKITFKVLENRSYPDMNIVRITLPANENRFNPNNNNSGHVYENKLEPGVYIISISNSYYYRESKFMIEFEIQGSDFNE